MSIQEEAVLSFKKMTTDHLEEVLAIEKESFPTPWSLNTFRTEIEDNDFAYYYVLLQNNIVIGYVGMWIILDEAHVTTIAVHPQYRARSFGKLLLVSLMNEAIKLQADKITLEVRPSNIYARRLYKNLGFREIGIRKGYYTDIKEDAIIMWKSLRS